MYVEAMDEKTRVVRDRRMCSLIGGIIMWFFVSTPAYWVWARGTVLASRLGFFELSRTLAWSER